MIKRIVSFALYQPLFVVLALILFVGGGVIAFNRLPVEAFPDELAEPSPEPLFVKLPPPPGAREARWAQLLGGPVAAGHRAPLQECQQSRNDVLGAGQV